MHGYRTGPYRRSHVTLAEQHGRTTQDQLLIPPSLVVGRVTAPRRPRRLEHAVADVDRRRPLAVEPFIEVRHDRIVTLRVTADSLPAAPQRLTSGALEASTDASAATRNRVDLAPVAPRNRRLVTPQGRPSHQRRRPGPGTAVRTVRSRGLYPAEPQDRPRRVDGQLRGMIELPFGARSGLEPGIHTCAVDRPCALMAPVWLVPRSRSAGSRPSRPRVMSAGWERLDRSVAGGLGHSSGWSSSTSCRSAPATRIGQPASSHDRQEVPGRRMCGNGCLRDRWPRREPSLRRFLMPTDLRTPPREPQRSPILLIYLGWYIIGRCRTAT